MKTNTALPLTALDIGDLARWASEQSPDNTYDYYSNDDCAMAQYLRARGVEFIAVLGCGVEQLDTTIANWSLDVDAALQSGTFGRLADELATIVAERRA